MAHERDQAVGGPTLEDGFTRVDAQPDPTLLTRGMEQTARWPAVRTLRAWYAHLTLSMLALAWLGGVKAQAHTQAAKGEPQRATSR